MKTSNALPFPLLKIVVRIKHECACKVLHDTVVVWAPQGNRTNRIHIRMHTHIHIYVFVYIYVCVHIHACVHMCVCVCVCVCVKNWLMQLQMEVKSQELQWVSWRSRAVGISSHLNLKAWEPGEPIV